MSQDNNNVISFEKFAKFLKSKAVKEPNPRVQEGLDVLQSLEPEEASVAIEFLLNYVFMEVRAGLGISDADVDVDIETLTIFNKIADIYEEAAGDCYFCSRSIDPNEDQIGADTKLCMLCKLKLGNFTEALGIPAGSVFQGMPRRKVQKTRIIKGEK